MIPYLGALHLDNSIWSMKTHSKAQKGPVFLFEKESDVPIVAQ